MPIDYSKWDALELSDDSDIEVHPNVDKKSFIRAKQAQIHQQRASRKHQIATLKYERLINDGFLNRIDRLLTALKSHRSDSGQVQELILQSLIESADTTNDKPPTPPEGVYTNTEAPTYSKMMAMLVDHVKKDVDESKAEHNLNAYITGVEAEKNKVQGLQNELLEKVAELEKEDKKHITSDDLHDGFNASHLSKKDAEPSKPQRTTELLNPGAVVDNSIQPSSGAEADIEDAEDIVASKEAKAFGAIAYGNYAASLSFIQAHPSIINPKDSDGLLAEAFSAQMDGKDKYALQCVHQSLLISYCRQLGKDGVALFFKRITTKDHNAHKLFIDDVQTTYTRIKTRVAEMERERSEAPAGVEQIQLQAVDPNTTINIKVPPPIPTDLSTHSNQPPPTEEEIAGRHIFESFPPNLQRALEQGSLDEINRVLGKMSVDEAEEVVANLSEGGMLSVEQGILDATTEEGQKAYEEIKRTGQLPSDRMNDGAILSEDPPLE